MKLDIGSRDAFRTRNLVVMALMVALKIVLSQFSIYVTPTFRILSFAYLPGAMVSMLYGPLAGVAFGLVGDVIGSLVKPAGPFFFGYTLSEMAAGLIYALFMYNKPLKIWRVAAARAAITLVVTFGLNFVWNAIMYGAVASKYFTGVRILNNIIQWPITVALIMIMGKVVLMAQSRLDAGDGLAH
jgi:ECF transporter S component (folate family)